MKSVLALLILVPLLIAQPPITSDITPRRAPIFAPPLHTIGVRWVTNDEPIVYRRTVSSNVIERKLWYLDGQLNTNESVLASNVVSCVTNVVQQP